MKKLIVITLILILSAGFAFAAGQNDEGSDKVVIGALIRNTDEQFVADYAKKPKKISSS